MEPMGNATKPDLQKSAFHSDSEGPYPKGPST